MHFARLISLISIYNSMADIYEKVPLLKYDNFIHYLKKRKTLIANISRKILIVNTFNKSQVLPLYKRKKQR